MLSAAKQFILQAIEDHNNERRNFAILHAVTAIELLLKDRLYLINPALIYADIDRVDLKNQKNTVSLAQAPYRLKNLGQDIDSNSLRIIQKFSEWRNKIVHHMPEYKNDDVDNEFPELLSFIFKFLKECYKINIDEVIPPKSYKYALKMIKEWLLHVDEIKEKARAYGKVIDSPCPKCGASGVVTFVNESRNKNIRSTICHLCGLRGYEYRLCSFCGERKIDNFIDLFGDGLLCSKCANDAFPEDVRFEDTLEFADTTEDNDEIVDF